VKLNKERWRMEKKGHCSKGGVGLLGWRIEELLLLLF
jgi:hypothetical protein